MKEEIRQYILNYATVENITDDTRIFDEGIVNSLFGIELMIFLEKTFGIKIKVEDLSTENFESITAICDFVQLKMESRYMR